MIPEAFLRHIMLYDAETVSLLPRALHGDLVEEGDAHGKRAGQGESDLHGHQLD
jgi:hypothetical protein